MKFLTTVDFLSNINLNQNQLLNATIQNLATAPASPVKGQIYFNTASNRLFVWNGTAWIGADAVGATMTAQDIVTTINESAYIIDLDNLPASLATAVTNMHTHTNKAILDGTTASFTTADETKLDGIEAGAQVNTVTSVASKTGAVTLTKTDVGLANVTNDAQVKKRVSSTSGYIPTWNGTTGDALNDGYSVETTLTGSSSAIPRADAVKTYVDTLLGANDAMVYKGTLGSGGTITALPTTYSAGWSYKVITAGTYAGVTCEVGDLIISIVDRSGSGNLNSDWTVIQTNLDGVVIGPASAVDSNFAAFNSTTGKLIKDSGFNSSSFATAGHDHNGTYTRKYAANVGGSTTQLITHNLNTMDVSVTLRTVASPYEIVYTDIEITSVNTITVKFNTAPAADTYRVVVIG